MKKKVISLLAIITIITNVIILPVQAAYTPTNEAYTLVNYLNNKVGESFASNRCQAFVYQSVGNAIGVWASQACAYEAWQAWGVSSSKDIPLGATVYFSGSSVQCGNHKAGHVGIYVGDGYIIHAASSKVQKTQISYIENYWSGYNYLGWGWNGGHSLATADAEAPVFELVEISSQNATSYTVHVVVKDNASLSGVRIYDWTHSNDQDDMQNTWIAMAGAGWEFYHTVDATAHNNEKNAWYATHLYAYDVSGNETVYNLNAFIDATPPIIENPVIYDVSKDGYTVTCTVNDNVAIDRVQFPTWTSYNDQDDLAENWDVNTRVTGTANGNTYTFRVNTSDHNGEEGLYNTHIYAFDTSGNISASVELSVEVYPTIRAYVDHCVGYSVGMIAVRGWAVAPYNFDETIDIHVYIGGPSSSEDAECHVINANAFREDIYGGSYHGFDTNIMTEKYGTQDVYFYAVNNTTGENVECTYSPQTVNITRGIDGRFDHCVEYLDGMIAIRGWMLDYSDLDETIDIHMYIGGPSSSEDAELHIIEANEYREDINGGSYCGFDTNIVTKKYGTQDVYFYAVNSNTGINKFIDSFTVNVNTPVDNVKLNTTSLTMVEGEKYTLSATVEPDDATNKTVTWESSDTSVATVENGIVTAVSPGEAIITATAGDKSTTCKVVVNKQIDYTVKSLSVDKTEDRVYAEVEITKSTDRDAVDTIVIGVYKDDVLIDRIYMRSKFAKGQSVVFGGYLENADGVTVKAFVWDGLNTMNSLSNVVKK